MFLIEKQVDLHTKNKNSFQQLKLNVIEFKLIILMFAEDMFYQCQALKDHTNAPERRKQEKKKHSIKNFLAQLDEQHNSEDQGIEDYKIGGYHPVHIGQVLINRYVVIQKLGWGHFSTVWLCKDFKYKTYVAVKIQKSSPQYMEAAFDEVEILQKIEAMTVSQQWKGKTRQDNHIVGLLNAFIHKSYYGNHFCMVFQILRCNLLDVIKLYNYEGVPLDICQQMSKQILQGLDYLHRVCGVIHTDLKPENVMLCLSKQQLKQIVENGQLNNNQLFQERVKYFRQVLGMNIQQSQKVVVQKQNEKVADLKQKLKDENLSKNQKKNIKKKLKKEKEKLDLDIDSIRKTENGQIENYSYQQKVSLSDLFDVRKGKIQINKKNKLKLPIKVKIGDLGNACWKHHHFSNEIQTRQYRSPQVILGQTYNETADMWSFACMMYQMLTGDLLFQPKKSEEWSKNDDHLAQIQQLLGVFDMNFIARSPKMRKYFTKEGKMKRLAVMNQYSLSLVLQIKNRIKEKEATRFSQFLLPMLIPEPQKRVKAITALNHPWLKINKFQTQYRMNTEQHISIKEWFYQNEQKFRQNTKKDRVSDASCQDNQLKRSKIYEAFEQKQKNKYKFADIRYIDRSFTDLGYVGYCDGIDFDKLDSCTNWQFK